MTVIDEHHFGKELMLIYLAAGAVHVKPQAFQRKAFSMKAKLF